MQGFYYMCNLDDFGTIDKNICSNCVNDEYLKTWINDNSEEGYCDYCNKNEKVVSIDELLIEIILPVIFRYYHFNDMPSDFNECFPLSNLDIDDVLEYFEDSISLNENVINDIKGSFPDENFIKNFAPQENEIYRYSWKSFSDLVKYKNRYFFLQETDKNEYQEKYSPLSILNIIEKGSKHLGLIKTLKKNTVLYRARVFKNEESVKLDDNNLGSPQNENAKNNRMNAAGISVFYCSDNSNTCIQEVMESCIDVKSVIGVGKFTNIEDLKYLDLTEIKNKELPSIFNCDEYIYREIIIFLKDLNKELTMPIEDVNDDEKNSIDCLKAIEYVPTQIFAEYFKLNVGLKGIKYDSAKDQNGTCFVLFFDNEQCVNENKYPYQKKCELKLIGTEQYKLKFYKKA